jgi:ornithine--oxo-acid transaminase
MSAGAAGISLDTVYAERVNPQWVRLLNVVQMNERYKRCAGCELFTESGRRILDFNSGYCVHNAGHNHPEIIAAVKDEMDKRGPGMLQSHVPEPAARLAEELIRRAGGRMTRVVFANSGSEAVEAAIKFARAYTRRPGLLYAERGFHGLTCGTLSLMSEPFWRDGFGPMLPGTEAVPFGSPEELESRLATRKFAAFITEPVQSEAGIQVPPPGYLQRAGELCRRYGTLFVLDEVQTGMYRTGPFLAAHRFGAEPDMVAIAKALSGGLIPVGATLMSEQVSDAVYSSLSRAFVHASTFGENALAMRAGLATLEVLERDGWGERAARSGDAFRERLAKALAPYEMVKEVRGVGMLSGIEFQAPGQLRLRAGFEAFRRINPGMFGQALVMRLFRDKNILTQICGNNFMVLKAAPPLVATESELNEFVTALREVVDEVHTSAGFWAEALGLARRAVNI